MIRSSRSRVPRVVRNSFATLRRRLHRDERGAMIFWFLGFFTLVMVMGALMVDLGVNLSDRRGQQRRADFMALAGVQALPGDGSGAVDLAAEWGRRNQLDVVDPYVQGADDEVENIIVDNSCWSDDPLDDPSVLDSITVDVSHEGLLLFLGELGIPGIDVGAHAKACIGSENERTGLRPWSISILNSPCFSGGDGVNPETYQFDYGSECVLRLESPSSQVGSVRLGDDPGDDCNEPGGGAAKYRENIEEGSDAVCAVGDVIDTEPGLNVGPTLTALKNLLATEGLCDAKYGNGDTIDDLLEIFEVVGGDINSPGPDLKFAAKDCTGPAGSWDDDPSTADSPRVVSLVLIDEFDKPQGFGSEPILYFASFYIKGCWTLNNGGVRVTFYAKCDPPGSGGSSMEIVGTFIHEVIVAAPTGPVNPFGARIPALVE